LIVRRPDAEEFVMCRLVSLSVALFFVALVARGEALGLRQGADGIAGTWQGSSVCVDRRALPACADERVIYEISVTPGQPDAVTVKADKIVDGKRVPMGVLDFTRDAKDGSWATEMETPNVHALWRLVVNGPMMTGSLTLLPSKTVVRRLDLDKSQSR
jgi:hypothetical protein